MFGGLPARPPGGGRVAQRRPDRTIDPADTEAANVEPHAGRMEMRGRTMDGWITVAPEGVRTDRELASWVAHSVAFVKTLPPK